MYRLPDALRPRLAAPFGPVHDTAGALAAARGRLLVTVGDVVTRTFLAAGVVPRLMVVDGVTLRGTVVEGALEGLPAHVRRVEAKSAAGEISDDLVEAITRALLEPGSTLVHVIGEEDLAALPAMALAPDGAAVCYGQPRQGVVVVVVDAAARRQAQEILHQMEVN